MALRLHRSEGGTGGRRLVLLHGLGVDSGIWRPLTDLIDQRWIAPDLRGHGRSPHAAPYGLGTYAADVAGLLGQDEEVVVVGHSLGAGIACMLASGLFGVRVARVITIGFKADWTDEERARLRRLADIPPKIFASRDEALAHYLHVSGLRGLVDPDDPVATGGVAAENGHWRLAADPRVYRVPPADVAAVSALARCPVRFGSGELDAMAPPASFEAFDPEPFVIPGAGHNAPVQRPRELRGIIVRELAAA
jgi:pimeloyl-ACP methyl ester carboxylesterase